MHYFLEGVIVTENGYRGIKEKLEYFEEREVSLSIVILNRINESFLERSLKSFLPFSIKERILTQPYFVLPWYATPNFEQRKFVVTIFLARRSFTYAISPIPGELPSHPFSPCSIRFFKGRLSLSLNDLQFKTNITNRRHALQLEDIL